MFFNKKLSRSQNDITWRDQYRGTYNKAYGSPGYSSSASTANPFAPKRGLSLYTQSLGLGNRGGAGLGLGLHIPSSSSTSHTTPTPVLNPGPASLEQVPETIEKVSRSSEEVSGSRESVTTVTASTENVTGSREGALGSKEKVSGSSERISPTTTTNVTTTISNAPAYVTTTTTTIPNLSPFVNGMASGAESKICDTRNCIHNYNCKRASYVENESDESGTPCDSPRQEKKTKEQPENNKIREEGSKEGEAKRLSQEKDISQFNEGNIPTLPTKMRRAESREKINTAKSNQQNTNINMNTLNESNNSDQTYNSTNEIRTQPATKGASTESGTPGPKPRRFNLRPSSSEKPSSPTTEASKEQPQLQQHQAQQQQNQNHSSFISPSTPQSPHSQASTHQKLPFSADQTASSTFNAQQQQQQPFASSQPNPTLNTASPPPQPQSPGAPGSPEPEWTDIEPTARHPPFPNPPTGVVSPTAKKDDRPYPTPGSYIPAHFCNVLYAITDRDLKFVQKGEFVGIPLKSQHQVSAKSFENHRKFVYAIIIDIINLKEFRTEASNLLRLNVGPNRKTKTSELKDVYQITSVDPDMRAAAVEEKERQQREQEEEKQQQQKAQQQAQQQQQQSETTNTNSSSFSTNMKGDTKTYDNIPEEEEEEKQYYSPAGSSYSNSNSGTGCNSQAEWEDSTKSPEEERMARKDLEDNARKKLEEERLKRKLAKEAEWRTKYGFDKDDPLLKKKQQRDEKKKNFWERCSGQQTVPEEPCEKPEADMRDIRDIHDLEEVKERISETLDDAWELPEAERKKAVKKLLLQWHPDKNIERGEEAKILFQHLQKEMKRCEGGIPRIKLTKWRNFMFGKGRPAQNKPGPAPFKGPTAEEPAAPKSPFTTRKEFTRSTSFTPGSRTFDAQQAEAKPKPSASDAESNGNGRRFAGSSFDTSSVPEEAPPGGFDSHESRDSFFKSYMDQMRETRSRARGTSPGKEAQPEAPGANTGKDTPPSWRSSPQASFDGGSPKSWRKSSTGANTMESRRWFDQAQRDLKSAKHDFDETVEPSFEWVCLKCHHAAEKALKAVILVQNLPNTETHDLGAIAAVAQNAQLTRLANQMTSLLGDPERIVYPNATHAPKIPADAFTQGIATMALSVAKSIINCCDLIVMKTR